MPESDLTHERYMRRCIELARRALSTADAPVGALVVLNGRVLAEGVESVKALNDVTAHAEIEALRAACAVLGSTDLAGSTLYTSVEPCVMCAYAIRLARVGVLVTGAPATDAQLPFDGWAVLSNPEALPRRPLPSIIRGVLARECQSAAIDRF